MSNSTRSPPVRRSKSSEESRPPRWKKYSFSSSALMKPKPRSATTFLMVPVVILTSNTSRTWRADRTVRSKRGRPRGASSRIAARPESSTSVRWATARANSAGRQGPTDDGSDGCRGVPLTAFDHLETGPFEHRERALVDVSGAMATLVGVGGIGLERRRSVLARIRDGGLEHRGCDAPTTRSTRDDEADDRPDGRFVDRRKDLRVGEPLVSSRGPRLTLAIARSPS